MDRGWLHVVNGDCAAGTLREARPQDARRIRIQHDVLSVGRLLPFRDLEGWGRERVRFWRAEVWSDAPTFEEMPQDLMAGAGELREAAGVVLWVGHALSDQLLLPSTQRVAELAGAPGLPMEVVRFAGTGLGTLPPEILRTPPMAEPVGTEARAVLRRVWDGITADDPLALLAAIAVAGEFFPELRHALGFFVTKYPDVRSGLSRWDQELLRSAPGRADQLVGRALRGNQEWLDPVGDFTLHARLRRLADPGLPRPVLERDGEVLRLTGFGDKVLAGDENFVEHNGIDEWIAGVHLDAAAGRVWFRRGAELVPSVRA